MRNKKYVWLFDAGHGGIVDGQYMTNGKRSPLWPDGTQYFEGVGNRQIVQKLIKKCDEHNIYNFDVVASEYDIALSERVKIANQYYKT